MEFNPSLGSLLTATDAQFISLYQEITRNGQDEFVETYKNLQKEAYIDLDQINHYSIRPNDLGCKIEKIIEVAKNACLNSVGNTTNLSYVPHGEELFRVFVYEPNMNPSKCKICSHTLLKETSFEIQNTENPAKIKISELEIHEIKVHEYFSVDPLTICNALGFIH